MLDPVPPKSFDLVVALIANEVETVNVEWLRSLFTIEERKEFLRLDYERALRGLEE